MFKKRVRDWGLEKNVKSDEMKAIIRKQTERARVGKKSTFCLRGNQVPEHKIKRFQKALGLLSDEQLLRLGTKTPPALICHTPLMSPLALPRELDIPKRIAKAVQDYTYGSFDSGTWRVYEDQLTSARRNMEDPSSEFYNECFHASFLFMQGDTNEAWRLLNFTSCRVEPMIRNNDVIALRDFGMVIGIAFLSSHFDAIAFALTQHISAMSAGILPSTHPLRKIFEYLIGLDVTQLKRAICTAIHSLQDCFGMISGRFCLAVIDLRLDRSELEYALDRSREIDCRLAMLRLRGFIGSLPLAESSCA